MHRTRLASRERRRKRLVISTNNRICLEVSISVPYTRCIEKIRHIRRSKVPRLSRSSVGRLNDTAVCYATKIPKVPVVPRLALEVGMYICKVLQVWIPVSRAVNATAAAISPIRPLSRFLEQEQGILVDHSPSPFDAVTLWQFGLHQKGPQKRQTPRIQHLTMCVILCTGKKIPLPLISQQIHTTRGRRQGFPALGSHDIGLLL